MMACISQCLQGKLIALRAMRSIVRCKVVAPLTDHLLADHFWIYQYAVNSTMKADTVTVAMMVVTRMVVDVRSMKVFIVLARI